MVKLEQIYGAQVTDVSAYSHVNGILMFYHTFLDAHSSFSSNGADYFWLSSTVFPPFS